MSKALKLRHLLLLAYSCLFCAFAFAFPTLPTAVPVALDPPTEAPASYKLKSNGFTSQKEFEKNADNFAEEATIEPGEDGGLGPLYNGTSCKVCHLNPVIGGSLDHYEIRCMVPNGLGGFAIPKNGDTLVRQLAVNRAIQQRVPAGARVTLRRSTSLLGIGFWEALRQSDRLAVQAAQPLEMRGRIVKALGTVGFNADGSPLQELGFGTFGWKCQDTSILDFVAGAQFKEKGLTSVFHPKEDTDLDGNPLDDFDGVPDPEDPPTPESPSGKNIHAYTKFIRATCVPPPSYELDRTPDVIAGKQKFIDFQCAVCHTPTWVTAPPGTKIPGQQLVSAAHGNKIIHPLSDFMLHDIGTCENEVPQGEALANEIRTAPLQGAGTLPRFRHDGAWATFEEAVAGHKGQATSSQAKYAAADALSQRQVKAYVLSR